MAKIAPNMPEWILKNPPYIANCKYCGKEAELRGKPDWEWWTHEIGCSAHCTESIQNETRFERYNIQELIKKWNEANKN